MKKTYIVSLFLCTAMLLLVGVCAYQYMYYNIEREKIEAQNSALKERLDKAVTVDTVTEPRVQKDTKYVMEIYRKDNSTFENTEKQAPPEYIGLTREELVLYLDEQDEAAGEEKKAKGFEGSELISFSEDRIIVRETYLQPPEEKFYLVVEDHYVTVYRADHESIYAFTDIRADSLPERVKEEVTSGKEVNSLEELYNFLETYSS